MEFDSGSERRGADFGTARPGDEKPTVFGHCGPTMLLHDSPETLYIGGSGLNLPYRHRHQFVERRFVDETAFGDNDDVVDRRLDFCEHVARNQDGAPFTGEVAQEAPQPDDAFGIESVGGFIEDEDLRIAEQGCRQSQPLAHSERESPGPSPAGLRKTNEVQHFVAPLVGGTHLRGENPQMVSGRTSGMETGGLELSLIHISEPTRPY